LCRSDYYIFRIKILQDHRVRYCQHLGIFLDFFETSKSQFQKNSKSGSREPGTSTDFPRFLYPTSVKKAVGRAGLLMFEPNVLLFCCLYTRVGVELDAAASTALQFLAIESQAAAAGITRFATSPASSCCSSSDAAPLWSDCFSSFGSCCGWPSGASSLSSSLVRFAV
jgi:hypothetical protein